MPVQVAAPLWQKDGEVVRCGLCHTMFSLTVRRHHCRACGKIFCAKCSSEHRAIPWLEDPQPQRVCDSCCRKLAASPGEEGELTASQSGLMLGWCPSSSLSEILEHLVASGHEEVGPALEFEHVMLLEEAELQGIEGLLISTSYRVIFAPKPAVAVARNSEAMHRMTDEMLQFSASPLAGGRVSSHPEVCQQIPVSSILELQRDDQLLQLTISTKDLRVLRLDLNTYAALNKLSAQLTSQTFPRPTVALHTARATAPQPHRYTELLRIDYDRLLSRQHAEPSAWAWERNELNRSYQMCNSYPELIITPAGISDDSLKEAAAFRSKGRLPVLSWISEHGAAICRSAQPNVGMRGSESASDTALVQTIAQLSPSCSLVIIDARPHQNALLNRVCELLSAETVMRLCGQVRGGGYEDVKIYEKQQGAPDESCVVSIEFMEIENLHAMRRSFQKLARCCQERALIDDPRSWHLRLARSKWLEHVSSILRAAVRVAKLVHSEHTSTLVHCSDGWDRTPQITSLAQVLLDSHYRTIDGLIVLVDKEWLSFGHCFEDRSNSTPAEFSPIFVQFIDCMWQLLRQSPTAFEYNSRLLLSLAEHSYTARFGTFLFNTEAERMNPENKTESFWCWVQSERARFTNEFWEPTKWEDAVLQPNTTSSIRLWSDYYLRYQPSEEQEHYNPEQIVCILKERITELEAVAIVEPLVERIIASAEAEAHRRREQHLIVRGVIEDVLATAVDQAHNNILKNTISELETVQHELELLRACLHESIEQSCSIEASPPEAPESWRSPESSPWINTPEITEASQPEHSDSSQRSGGPSSQNDTSGSVITSDFRSPASYGSVSQPRVNIAIAKENWAPDYNCDDCGACNKSFGLFRRRHHCRSCGNLFCGKCSSFKYALADVARNTTEMMRVCADCFSVLEKCTI